MRAAWHVRDRVSVPFIRSSKKKKISLNLVYSTEVIDNATHSVIKTPPDHYEIGKQR